MNRARSRSLITLLPALHARLPNLQLSLEIIMLGTSWHPHLKLCLDKITYNGSKPDAVLLRYLVWNYVSWIRSPSVTARGSSSARPPR